MADGITDEITTAYLPGDAPARRLSSTARHARVGDRLRVQCADINNQQVTVAVEALQVDRLMCGCDRIYTARPGGEWPTNRMQLLPLGCYHDQVDSDDYDEARRLAAEAAGGVS